MYAHKSFTVKPDVFFTIFTFENKEKVKMSLVTIMTLFFTRTFLTNIAIPMKLGNNINNIETQIVTLYLFPKYHNILFFSDKKGNSSFL